MTRDRFAFPFSPAARRLVAAAVLVLPLAGCTSAQIDNGQSPAYLIITNLQAASGAEDTELGNSLQSDVLTEGGVLQDPGAVSFSLALKDPGSLDSPTVPSSANFITVTRYHVRYVRSDGRNTPGLDVPYPFDGGMTVTVSAAPATGDFTLVRVQAKLEAPLTALRQQGGAIAISTIAEVTFFGHDQAGRDVSVTGNISVNFADWADPE